MCNAPNMTPDITKFTQRKLKAINKETVDGLKRFLDESSIKAEPEDISTAMISTGAEGSSIKSVIDQLSDYQSNTFRRSFTSISASTGPNLKALLKAIIQKATSRSEGIDEDEADTVSTSRRSGKLLNYDLQILANHVKSQNIRQVAITVHDTEAFGGDLLSDLVETLGCWQDRINFTLIFCVATSVDFLEQRLSREALRYLNGSTFDVAPLSVEVEQVFDAIVEYDPPVWIGPNLMSMLLERQTDYIQSIDCMVDEVQYAYMSCYYANALSLFLDDNVKSKDVPQDHYEAIRNLDSFRSWCRKLLDNDETQKLKGMLDSNAKLHEVIVGEIKEGRKAMYDITTAAELIQDLQKLNPGTQVMPKSKLYIQAMSNKLKGSTLIRSLLLSIRKAPSNITDEIVATVNRASLPSEVSQSFVELRSELSAIVKTQDGNKQPLRSEDDIANSTLRTTVVAKKVELSKQKSTLSKQDADYTKLIRTFTDLLEQYFDKYLVDPKTLLFNEIFLYDLKSPHREVFTPRPRHAIERALAAPHDYLDCDCCAPGKDDGDEQTLSASQPATAILYQLYLESGNLINASDLWQAFKAVVGDEKSEEQNMALFQRGLAELKYAGLVKGTRKRVDHVAKVAWRGL